MYIYFVDLLSTPTFDHYTLALQWTPNVFMRQRSCIPQVSRLLTVHGLWPSNIVWPQPPGFTFVQYVFKYVSLFKFSFYDFLLS